MKTNKIFRSLLLVIAVIFIRTVLVYSQEWIHNGPSGADVRIIATAKYDSSIVFRGSPYANLLLDASNSNLPKEFEVKNGYPNPFNPTITIPFAIPATNEVSITVYNILGQIVYKNRTLYKAGYYSFVFDSMNNGVELGSGMYFLQIKYKDHCNNQKIMLLK